MISLLSLSMPWKIWFFKFLLAMVTPPPPLSTDFVTDLPARDRDIPEAMLRWSSDVYLALALEFFVIFDIFDWSSRVIL